MTEANFTKHYDTYADAIFRYCFFKTSDREQAKDLAQETFVRAWDTVAAGTEIGNMKAFLYRVASNLIIDWRRKKKSASLEGMMEEGFDPPSAEHLAIPEMADGRRAIELIQKLDPIYAEVLTLRFVEGCMPKEIAEITGETENVISVRINRGIEKLKILFQP